MKELAFKAQDGSDGFQTVKNLDPIVESALSGVWHGVADAVRILEHLKKENPHIASHLDIALDSINISKYFDYYKF